MRFAMRLAVLVFLAATASLAAGSWSGYMVDSGCYKIRDQNTRSVTTVDRDMNANVTYCAPRANTKSFGVVQKDWTMLPFNSEGNAKAAEFVHNAGKQSVYPVVIAGEMQIYTLKVDSISMAK